MHDNALCLQIAKRNDIWTYKNRYIRDAYGADGAGGVVAQRESDAWGCVWWSHGLVHALPSFEIPKVHKFQVPSSRLKYLSEF